MLFIASDHAGFVLKEKLKKYLVKIKIDFTDLGTNSGISVDYPDLAKLLCNEVLCLPNSSGVLICGTGIGMCITANRFKGIRAVLPFNVATARLSRSHNNANVLCLGGRVISYFKALRFLKTFLKTPFLNEERHINRIEKIDN
ncbi:MAG: ribose 5-phosphate isomerase B [Clostridia bacterium]|jgi:ribose 5-phosphate isomerase B|nr:ribose 5-phosphate isomerase B [Clostridia bacterium]MDD4275384.1 ribose 5-phosphate isomerase B [Clostridia bacterium]